MAIEIRKAKLSDLDSITAIYNEAILNGTATFDTEPKSLATQLKWFQSRSAKHPIIVLTQAEVVVGWASLNLWSERAAYDGAASISIYLHQDSRRQGFGKLLLQRLLELGKEVGLHTLISQITRESEASIRLHQKFNFQHVGILKEVGFKFDKYLDVHLMQIFLTS